MATKCARWQNFSSVVVLLMRRCILSSADCSCSHFVFTEWQIDELIQEMDKNSDGKIELCEYMDKILGPGWVVSDTDAEGEPIKCGR